MKDKTKLLHERALITCVIMLFLCIILKLFGFQWFDLDTSIPILNKIDDVVMNSEMFSFIYSFIFKFINGYLICCICLKKTKFNMMLLGPIRIGSMVLSRFSDNNLITMLYDMFSLYLLCFCESNFKDYMLSIILNIIYQFVSLFIRDLGVHQSYYGLTISIILMVDYYIMLIITYLYLKKGDKTLCGIVHVSFSSLANRLWRKRTTNSKQSLQNKER